ncbi:MAG TPA: hypothetical protein VF834_18505, partial [Streptosporangiaceae bacterium]
AGQIEDAVVVCGNLIEAFDHERAMQVLALPDPLQRAETLRLMRRYVSATPGDPDTFKLALTSAYSAALGRRAVSGEISAAEQEKAAELDRRFGSAQWLAGPRRADQGRAGQSPAGQSPAGHSGTQRRLVKVRAGIWTLAAQAPDGARLVASVVNGTLDRVVLTAPQLNGQAREAERSLTGTTIASAAEVLSRLGGSGPQLATVLAGAEGRL